MVSKQLIVLKRNKAIFKLNSGKTTIHIEYSKQSNVYYQTIKIIFKV